MAFPLSRPQGRYTVAGQITRTFDGGNHPIKGEIWRCKDCGALLLPSDEIIHEGFHAQIDGLLSERT